MAPGLKFQCLMHFELILEYDARLWSSVVLCTWLSSLLNTIY